MTYDSYFDLTVDSARATGYNAFLPSLCSVEGESVVMKVLEGELSEDGDERLAIEWATSFMKDGGTKHFILDPCIP